LPAEVPRIFVHHQIHFVFHERLLGKRLDDDPVLRPRYNELKAQEIHLLDRFDAVLALSEVDARILRDALGTTPVYCSSFGIRESTRPAAGKAARPFDGTVLYVGSEYHYPNLDAVNWFLDHVWHEIAAADSRLRFRLVGEWSEATRKRLRRHPRAECLGFVPDLESLLRTSILVVPVRIGSGVRTKILQAMMEGAPVVSTTVGAEGIPVRNGRELLIRDDPHEFAQAVLTLADDATLRRRLATSARRLAAKKFSVSAAGMTREWVYMQVVADWRAGDRKDAAKSTAEWMGRAPGATPGMEDFSAAPVALQIAEHS
jgi:glycosyltransferase involved in cell wall biosynthesis